MSALLLVGTLATTDVRQEGARTQDEYLGTYGSVTESECNVELELLGSKEAQIVKTCRLEHGSHQDIS